MKIAYVTDSTSTLQTGEDVFVVPLEIILDGTSYAENVALTPQHFYDTISQYNELKTSQPNLGAIEATFQRIVELGYEKIVVIALSSKVSGTYAAFRLAAQDVSIPVDVYDLLSATYLSDRLIRDHRNGATEEDLFAKMAKSRFFVVPKNLKQLQKSGRVSGIAYLIGSFLKVQPILQLLKGEVVATDKVRSQKQLEQFIVDEIAKAPVDRDTLHVLHTCEPETAAHWQDVIQAKFPHLTVTTSVLPISLAVHTGKGTVILSWFNA